MLEVIKKPSISKKVKQKRNVGSRKLEHEFRNKQKTLQAEEVGKSMEITESHRFCFKLAVVLLRHIVLRKLRTEM